ncbi:ribonuclease P/MRP protein subunit RPP1 [Halomicrobium zhouii]|uniref:Ribonuclease P protein component 3 n=1 Tax=Halomicrobium zhouii TaxID=767519 RepID=A0A1I6LVS4_9EURY|nr:RNase P subunit p30 family protein [Halomicrobium zhouii]SFS07543.1 ribonuclease P/MRP protein subunit RPP1 [Halomicrobium zhouii]
MRYEAVHARPDGDSTVARLALTASEYGFDGIVVRNHGDALADYDPEVVSETYDVDVVPAVEVRADDPSQASGYVGNHRPDTVVLAVHGGTVAMNRFAVEQAAVDVLAHPMRDDGDFNHVLAKEAAANGVRVEFSLRDVLDCTGGRRVRRLQSLRKLRELVDYYDVPYVVSADPTSHLQLRAPRELVAVGEAIGFSSEQVESGLAEWGRIASRNRERLSDSFVEPGVRRVDERDPGSTGDDHD